MTGNVLMPQAIKMASFQFPALLVMLLLTHAVTSYSTPDFCSNNNGVYECDYRFCVPLDANDFDPPPQRLHLYNIDGSIGSETFVNWDLTNSSGLDDNFDSELTLTCLQGGGEMILNSTAFEGMDMYIGININNCHFPRLPSRAFRNFGVVNYFGLSGGEIESIAGNAMGGLTIRRLDNSVTPKGELFINDVDFPGGTFPDGFLLPQVHLTTLIIHRAGLHNVPVDLISLMVNLTTLSLSNNGFTSLPNNMFTGVSGITTLNFEGIKWVCSCENLWWLDYVTDNGMRIISEVLCDTPVSYSGRRARSYLTEVCEEGLNCGEGDLPAVNLGNVTCLTYLQIFIYVMAILAFFGAMLGTCCWLHTRRQLSRMSQGRPMSISKNSVRHRGPRPAPPPSTKSRW